jgi:hypothetical protein
VNLTPEGPSPGSETPDRSIRAMGIPIRPLLVASLVFSSIFLHVAAKTLDPYKVSYRVILGCIG